MAKINSEDKTKSLVFQTTEAYKKARTNIVYSIVKKGCKKIIFTGSGKGEGKTTTAINVAIALSQQMDTKVLVIDCDLRRPAVHTVMGIESDKGLVKYFGNECSYEELIVKTDNKNLDLITYGAIPPNPSELLSSDAMVELVAKLEEEYDFIIFDTPPVNIVVDLIPLIGLSDGVVFVVKDNATTYSSFNKAVEMIKRNKGKILGVIVNGIPAAGAEKGGYYFSNKENEENNTYYS